jgi:hypothetical protein
VQKHGHKYTISARNQVGRHGLYFGHYSRVFVAPENAQNAETKHQSGAVGCTVEDNNKKSNNAKDKMWIV